MLLGAEYYDDEYTTRKLLTINGDADQYEELMKRKAAEELDRTKNPPAQDGGGDYAGEGLNGDGET